MEVTDAEKLVLGALFMIILLQCAMVSFFLEKIKVTNHLLELIADDLYDDLRN